MRSITKADLDNLVRRLNIEKKNKPTRTIGRYKNGKFKSDKGFHISSAYGGVQLVFSKKDSSAESSVHRDMYLKENCLIKLTPYFLIEDFKKQ
jgi:hypothetical protein